MSTKPKTKKKKVTNGDYPAWVEKMLDLYRDGIAHAFIAHFNVADYVVPGLGLRPYFGKLFASRSIVVYYNRAEGLTFANQSDEDKFRELVLTPQGGGNSTISRALNESRNGPSGGNLPRRPDQVLPLLEALLRIPPEAPAEDEKKENHYRGAVVVIDFAETLAPSADLAMLSPEEREVLITLERWGRDPEIAAANNLVFLVANEITELHSNIRRAAARWEAIEIPLPDRDARLRFIEWYLSELKDELALDVSPETFANSTAGLSLLNIEDVFLRARRVGALSRDLVKDRKATLISQEYSQVLEVWEPTEHFEDIGGLLNVKDYFRRSVVSPIKEGNLKRVPQGVLMLGPAGTGKTIMARAVANEAGVNAVLFRVGRILGKYVGQSEGQLERALRAIIAMAPAVVFIDEIDQQINRGGSDGGTSNRIFARLLEVMSDNTHRGSIVWLAATNRPDLIDAALKRPGRFDAKIPFLVPDADDRQMIFDVMVKKYLTGAGIKKSPKLLEATEGWTGAEIEGAVIKASQLVDDEGLEPGKALKEAVVRLKPSTADIDFMTNLAIAEVNDVDLLPERFRGDLDDRDALEEKIQSQAARRAPREV